MKSFKKFVETQDQKATPGGLPPMHFEQFPMLQAAVVGTPKTGYGKLNPQQIADYNERRKERFTILFQQINEFVAQGSIPNPRFQELKSSASRLIEDGYDHNISEKYAYAGKWESLPKEWQHATFDFRPEIHTLEGKLKKLNKMPDHAVKTDIKRFYDEIAPLCRAILFLKEHAFKKQPKPAEDRKAPYVPPITAHEDVKTIHALLIQITQQVREQYVANLMTSFTNIIETFWAKWTNGELGNNGPKAQYDYFRNNMLGHDIAGRTIEYGSGFDQKLVLKPTWKAILKRYADTMADQVQQAFVSKNGHKLASILTAKGNMQEAKVLNAVANGYGIMGTIHISFKDGSQFTVQNSTVLSYSVHGKPFLRFPTTFHNVRMNDGKPMGRPSEERMNTVFVGKAEGSVKLPADSEPIQEPPANP